MVWRNQTVMDWRHPHCAVAWRNRDMSVFRRPYRG